METNQNIGKWSAIVKNEGNTPHIFINGTFPTNGEKPLYQLTKNDPQGINTNELVLTLIFGSLATSEGTSSSFVGNNWPMTTVDEFKTVLVIDDNGRTIANINVVQS